MYTSAQWVLALPLAVGFGVPCWAVDKFQGQEAPVAILSLTASSAEEAPRGLGFLLSANRLNVAMSRAQCLSIVVGSPMLAAGSANNVEEAEQLNSLCRIIQASHA